MLVTLEESVEEITADVASMGLDLGGLQRDGLLVVYAFRVEPMEVVGTEEFNFEPLFLLLDAAIKRIGARRVALDTIEAQPGPGVRADRARDRPRRRVRGPRGGAGGLAPARPGKRRARCPAAAAGGRDTRLQQREELQRRERELLRGSMHGRAELAAQQAELKRTAGRDERLAADPQAAWQAMGTPRWADPDEDDDEEKR